jgi:uncharacterized protein
MRLDDQRESENYEVQQGGAGGGGFGSGFGGGGGMLGLILPLVASRFGCGGIAVVLVLFMVFGGGLSSIGSMMGGGAPVSHSAPGARPTTGELTEVQRFSVKVLGSTEDVWTEIFAKSGQRYEPATLSFFSQSGRSGCGIAQSAMGPFYCPTDRKIYLDTTFFDEMRQRFGAPGDFAQAYVIAHEVGHHIQGITGVLGEVNKRQQQASEAQGNALQVRVELQADCYAGVWGRRTGLMEAGDMEEGLKAAQAIGDDTLQRNAGQRPMPDSFTHGSSEQRMAWLRRGLETGDPAACDTFANPV